MNFLRNISIRKKILLIPVVGALGFFAYLLTSIYLIKENNLLLQDARDTQFPILQIAMANLHHVEKIQETLSYAVSSGEQEGLETAKQIAAKFREESNNARTISRALSGEIDRFLLEFDDYFSSALSMSEGMVNDSIDFSTIASRSRDMADKLHTLQATLNQFYNQQLEVFNQAFSTANAKSESLFVIGTTIGVLVSLLLIVVGITISGMIKQSIDQVIARLKDIAEDNGDLTLRLSTKHNDEIGELVKWFNTFMDKLQSVIQQIVETAPPLANLASDVNNLSSDITATLEQQNFSVAESKNNIELMSHSVASIAQNASEAATAAQIADEEAIKGQAIVTSTVKGIQQLSRSIGDASAAINKLQEDTTSVNVVLDVIKSIAEQTNLLALNAAIEAARAGEQGRGFAVVADEVRGLASRTQESTEEINTILAQLKKAAAAAVQTMDESTNAVEKSVTEANHAGNSLQAITDTVNTINSMNEQIASATDEQQSISGELVMEAERIQEQTTNNASSANQLNSVSDKLSSLALNLEHITRQFRV